MKKKSKSDGVLVMVYGTLKKGNKNEHYMRDAYKYLGEGETVWSNLLLVNMTGKLGHWFPGAVEISKAVNEKTGRVRGEVYLVPYTLLRRLDAHEGCYLDSPRRGNSYGYYRKRLKIDLDDGGQIVAEVYLMTPERAIKGIRGGGNVVEGGVWSEPPKARAARLARAKRIIQDPPLRALDYQPSPLMLARARARFAR